MAPLPENNTARWYVDYSTTVSEHTLMLRSTAGAGSPDLVTVVNAFFSAIASVITAHTINRVRYSAVGQNFSIVVPTTLDGDTYGTGATSTIQDSIFLNFVGRSIDGRRVKAAVFGVSLSLTPDFRYTNSDSVPVANAVAALNSNPAMALAISGADTTWYPYANIGVNAYWQREHRA